MPTVTRNESHYNACGAPFCRAQPELKRARNVGKRMNWQGEIAPESEDLEAASAAKLRGLPVAQSWEAIERAARQLAVAASARPFVERARSVELATAARALEAVAQGAPAGGSVARERGVWASAAMAAGGNFPSAGVAIRRTFPRGAPPPTAPPPR